MTTKLREYAIYMGEVHYYAWKCPICESINETPDDPIGAEVTCDNLISCGWAGLCKAPKVEEEGKMP